MSQNLRPAERTKRTLLRYAIGAAVLLGVLVGYLMLRPTNREMLEHAASPNAEHDSTARSEPSSDSSPDQLKVEADRDAVDNQSDTRIEPEPESAPSRPARIPVRFITPDGQRLRAVIERGWLLDAFPVVVAAKDLSRVRSRPWAPGFDEVFESGCYRVPNKEGFDGVLELLSAPPLIVAAISGGSVLESRHLTHAPDVLEFVVQPEVIQAARTSLTVCLVDGETGEPIQNNLAVGIARAASRGAVHVWPTDETGCMRMEGLPVGDVRVVVQVAGYAAVDLPNVSLLAGTENQVGPIVLEQGACLHGVVRDEQGGDVTVPVWTARRRRDGSGVELDVGMQGDWPSGFAVCSLPRGELLLGVIGDAWAVNPIAVNVQQLRNEGLELVARPGRMVTLEFADDERTPESIWIENAAGEPVWSWPRFADKFTVRLLEGSYRVTARCTDRAEFRRDFTIGSEDVVVRLETTK